MGAPDMTGKALSNVATEHTFKIRATFAATSELTYRSKDATIAKTTTTTFTVTLPQSYAEITGINYSWFAVATVANLTLKLTTNSIATTGVLVFTTELAAGTATAPATGDVLFLEVSVSRDALNNRYVG